MMNVIRLLNLYDKLMNGQTEGSRKPKGRSYYLFAAQNPHASPIRVGISMLAIVAFASAYVSGPFTAVGPRATLSTARVTMGYVPDGMTAEEYQQIKAKEAAKKKNLGAAGTNRFQSRR